MRSSTPGRAGSRYMRPVEMPSSNSARRAASIGASSLDVRLHHGAGRGHPEALLVGAAVGVAVQVAGRLVGAGEPGADHHVGWRRRPGRGRRRAGGARRRRPTRGGRACGPRRRTRRTAENCGRPTPVIIRVVHMAPGPTPTFTMSAPASTRSRTPPADTTLPAHSGTGRSSAFTRRMASIILSWWPWAVSSTSTSTPASTSAVGLGGDVAVHADRGGDPQAAGGRRRAGLVEGGAQGAGAGEDADEVAVVVDDRHEAAAALVEQVERGLAGRWCGARSAGRSTSPGRGR